MEKKLVFKVEGKNSIGRELHPESILLSEFNDFCQWVKKFVFSNEKEPKESYFKIIDKCVVLELNDVGERAFSDATEVLSAIEADGGISMYTSSVKKKHTSNKFKLLTELQNRCSDNDHYYTISDGDSTIAINKNTHFNFDLDKYYHDYETYVLGELQQAGGTSSINIHIRPRDQAKNIIIELSKKQVVELEFQNRLNLYKNFAARCSAKINIITQDIRSYKLIEYYPYFEQPNQKNKNRFFNESEKVWEKVDAEDYTKDIRG